MPNNCKKYWIIVNSMCIKSCVVRIVCSAPVYFVNFVCSKFFQGKCYYLWEKLASVGEVGHQLGRSEPLAQSSHTYTAHFPHFVHFVKWMVPQFSLQVITPTFITKWQLIYSTLVECCYIL